MSHVFLKIIKSYARVSVAKYFFVKLLSDQRTNIWIFRDKFPGNSKGFERVATTEVKRIGGFISRQRPPSDYSIESCHIL